MLVCFSKESLYIQVSDEVSCVSLPLIHLYTSLFIPRLRSLAEPRSYSRVDVGRCDAGYLFPDLPPLPTVPSFTVIVNPSSTTTSQFTTTTSTTTTTAAATTTTTEKFTTARIDELVSTAIPSTSTSAPTTTTVVTTTTEQPVSVNRMIVGFFFLCSAFINFD